MAEKDKIELKITKDKRDQPVELSSMSLHAAAAFQTLLGCALNIVRLSGSQQDVTISIQKGSAMVVAEAVPEKILQIRDQFTTIIKRTSTDSALIKEWKQLQELVKANGLHYEFNFLIGNKRENISLDLKKAKTFRARRNKTEIGYSNLEFIKTKLIENGGKVPNIHVDDADGHKLTISCTERSAKKANAFLYEPILISVWITRRGELSHYELCDSYFQKDINYFNRFREFIIRYKSLPIVAALKELHFETRSYLDKKDYNYLRKFLRLFIHDSTDINILQTLLLLLEPFEKNDRLSWSIKQMRDLFNGKILQIQKGKK